LTSPDEQALFLEFEQRASTFPDIGVDLYGYGNEDFANTVGSKVAAHLHIFGKLLNLERLHKVIVAYDYAGALANLERGVETRETLTPTKDDLGEGIAMTPAVLVNDELRSVIVLNAAHMAVLAHDDEPEYAEYRERMIYTIAHECGHVHDLAMHAKMLPGVIGNMRHQFRDAVLFAIASGCWTEYIASRLSACFGGDFTTADYEGTLCSVLEQAKDRADAAIRQYRMHGDRQRLVQQVTGQYHRVMISASYLLGHLDGLEKSVEECAPKATEHIDGTPYFKPYFATLRSELRAMYETYGEWKTIEVYEPLKQTAYDLIKNCGLDVQQRGNDGYVDVPFTPETMPSPEEKAEFLKLNSAAGSRN